MKLKHITLITLVFIGCAMHAAPQQPKVEQNIQVDASKKSSLEEAKETRLFHLIGAAVYFGSAYGTYKVTQFIPLLSARIFGDLMAFRLGWLAAEHLVDAAFPSNSHSLFEWVCGALNPKKINEQIAEPKTIVHDITSAKN